MDFLLDSYHEPLGTNLFQKAFDYGLPVPPPIDGRFRVLPDGTFRVTPVTLTQEFFRVVDVTP